MAFPDIKNSTPQGPDGFLREDCPSNSIRSGFSSLSASCYLAKSGYNVSIYEKNSTIGGRARQLLKDGFTFDIGPSWYWMPDIFDKFLAPILLN